MIWGLFVPLVCQASQHWIGSDPRVVVWPSAVPADRIRLGVRDEGVYRVTADEIAQASGMSVADVNVALATCGLSLSCQGRPIAWRHESGALYFYGVPTREFYAPENVYWLSMGAGVAMREYDAAPDAGDTTNAWFVCEEHYRRSFVEAFDWRDRRSSNATLTNVLNFGEWVAASPSDPSHVQSRILAMPGYCSEASICVTVRTDLVSYRDFVTPDTHTCEILANGVSCGSQGWSNEQAMAFDYVVPSGSITNESVCLSVCNVGGTTAQYDFMILDVALRYPRFYSAVDGVLLCTGGDVGMIAALGVAVGGITAAMGALLQAFFGLGIWMPLGVLGMVALISGPSMLVAWLKLRQRNLGPLLDANGWAVNAQAKINVPLGKSLTAIAALPAGTISDRRDPYAEKTQPWWLYGALIALLALSFSWYIGSLDAYLPAPAKSITVLGELAPAATVQAIEAKAAEVPAAE